MNIDQKRAIIQHVTGSNVRWDGIQYATLDFSSHNTLTLYGLTEEDAISAVYHAARAYMPLQFAQAERRLRLAEADAMLEAFARSRNHVEYWSAHSALGQMIGTEFLNGRLEEGLELQRKRSEINKVVGPRIEALA